MRHAGGVLYQRVGVAEGDGDGNDGQVVQQLLARLKACHALHVVVQLEAEYAAEKTVLHLPACQLVAGVVLQPGIIDPLDIGVGVQIFGERHGVPAVPLDTQRQCFHTAQDKIAVERRGRAAVELCHGTAANLRNIGGSAHNNAAQGIAVTVDVLGDAVQHKVSAELENVLNRRRREGRVHDHANVLSGNRLDGGNVRDLYYGVVGRLEINHLGVGLDGSLQRLKVGGVHKGGFNAHIGEVDRGDNVRAAVNGGVENHMVAAFQKRDHHRADRAHAGGGSHGILAALHGGALQFKGSGGGVSAAGVQIAGELLCEFGSALLHRVKAEGGGLINRCRQCAVSRVVLLPGVDDHRLKIKIVPVRLAHVAASL